MRSLIILAAGQGTRTQLQYNKMFYKVKEKTLLEIVIKKFKKLTFFDEIIIVISEKEKSQVEDILSKIKYDNFKVVNGGKERYFSVYEGVKNCKNEYIYIHDGARVNLNIDIVKKMEKEIIKEPNISCFVLANKVKDTISIVQDGYIQGNLKRESLMAIQTPQVIKKKEYLKLFDKKETFTDEGSLFFKNKYKVKIVEGDDSNFKVTTTHDLKNLKEEYE